ncbi:DUF6883 domain-containing protein [Gimesia chilikensis]|uniref:DUF6883 domain-containing protein n=1 Tax=Gimesia chilikensis TaxID=2605989 RepID=UPI0011A050A8
MSINDKLPNADECFVETAKLTEYLLSTTHPIGRSKAIFFMAFGFSIDDVDQMETSLRQHGQTQLVVQESETEHGVKYVLECSIDTPDARNPCIRSVWILETGRTGPRLVTAYPN